MLFHWAIKTIDKKQQSMPLFICNIFKCKFKSCLRSSFHFFLEKFFLNINLELILHNISCGVKEIPSFWCHEKSISKLGISNVFLKNLHVNPLLFMIQGVFLQGPVIPLWDIWCIAMEIQLQPIQYTCYS